MQNQNVKLAAQLVTKRLHQEKGNSVTDQAGVQHGQTSSQHAGQLNEQRLHGQTHEQAQTHHPGQNNAQGVTMPQQPQGTQYTQDLDKPGVTKGHPYAQHHGKAHEAPDQPYLQQSGQGNAAPPYTSGQCQPNAIGQVQGQHYQQAHHFPQPSVQGGIPSGYTSPSEPVSPRSPSDDFGDVYRTGNFGIHFGKVNIPRGKRWLLAHGILSFFMFVFTLAATIMMRDYTNTVFKDMLLAFTWMAALQDWMLFASAAFLLYKLSTLKNPLTTLMVVRTCSALTFALNLFFFLVGLLGLLINEADFLRLTSKEVGFLKFMFVMITILMAAKIVTGYSFVFMWWKNRECCRCLAGYCVFEEGAELAPGVANSTGTQNIIAFGQGAAAFGEAMNRS